MEKYIEPLVKAGVSESAIEDILCKIDEAQQVNEDLETQITKKYGNSEKGKETRGKARSIRWEEEEQAAKREGKSWDDIIDKRNDTKGTLGRDKTSNKQMMPKEMAKRKRAHEAQQVAEAIMYVVEELKKQYLLSEEDKKDVDIPDFIKKYQQQKEVNKVYAPIKKKLAVRNANQEKGLNVIYGKGNGPKPFGYKG